MTSRPWNAHGHYRVLIIPGLYNNYSLQKCSFNFFLYTVAVQFLTTVLLSEKDGAEVRHTVHCSCFLYWDAQVRLLLFCIIADTC